MRCLRLADVPGTRQQVFRYSRARALIVAVIAACAGAVMVVLGWPSLALAYYLAGIILLGLVILHNFVRARFRSSNWLVQAGDDGLFVQFRSYLNYRFPKDAATVVFIPYREIRAARLALGSRTVPDSDARGGLTTQPLRLVELELAGDTAPLAQALADERARSASDWRRHGASTTRYQHHPVRMVSPTTLQMEWEVVPDREELLEILSRYSTIEPAVDRSQDLGNLEGLSREEQERRLVELSETGQELAAVALARTLYSYDLSQAKSFVDGLRSGKASGSS
jgi:hypothetical protein